MKERLDMEVPTIDFPLGLETTGLKVCKPPAKALEVKIENTWTPRFKPAIATMSLGGARLYHLPEKLETAARVGFQGVELYWEDFHSYTLSTCGQASANDHLITADHVRQMCENLDLSILSLQPFRNFEGTADPQKRAAAIEEFSLWLDVASRLGTDTIGVPSTIVRDGHVGDVDTLVRDLREIAALAAARIPPLRIAYENLCFGAHIRTWQQAYDIVKKVDMLNFGFLPDTFNIAGSAWADPAADGGKVEGADQILAMSLAEFGRLVEPEHIFLVQVADAELMERPLVEGHPFHIPGQLPRMSWSRNARLFPFEECGYLPIMAVLKAIMGKMRRGQDHWVSMEVFSRSTDLLEPTCVEQHAARAWASWIKLAEKMGWRGGDSAELA